MSFQTLLKSASKTLCQPTGIAVIASLGLHGLVGFSLPLLNTAKEEPDLQQRVQVVDLTPEQRLRLPPEVLSQPSLNDNLPLNPTNTLDPSLSRRIPNLALVPYGNPSYRIPFVPRTNTGYVPWVPSRPTTIWGAGPRQPISSAQQSVPVTVDPFFDSNNLQAAVPTWTAKPTDDNLQIHGKPKPSADSSDPNNQPPQQPDNPETTPTPNQADPNQSTSLPEKIPTQAVEDLRKLQEQQGQLFAYNSAGTSADEGYSNTQGWAEKMLTQAGTAEFKQLIIQPVYPSQARVVELSGKAVVGVLVDGNGQIIGEPELIQSTGYPILNQAAIDTVLGHQFEATSQPQPYLITLKFDPQIN